MSLCPVLCSSSPAPARGSNPAFPLFQLCQGSAVPTRAHAGPRCHSPCPSCAHGEAGSCLTPPVVRVPSAVTLLHRGVR